MSAVVGAEAGARISLPSPPQRLLALFDTVRAMTGQLVRPLSEADATVQSMPDASPAKWHLAHTTWFFETMVLVPHRRGYRPPHPEYRQLFNSYYESLGERHPRPQRGLLTRPTLADVLAYRATVEDEVRALLHAAPGPEALALIELGCHHEQQHQELILTDILHLFAQNPLRPAYRPSAGTSTSRSLPLPSPLPLPLSFVGFEGGVTAVGHDGAGFAFDCEGPRHQVVIEPFALANRPVTNAEWLEFIDNGGYRQPLLWLSEGWARVCAEGWQAPLYWESTEEGAAGKEGAAKEGVGKEDAGKRFGEDGPGGVRGRGRLDRFRQMTLAGPVALDPDAPVSHLSYFEADAFAQWAGARLPTEFEWELAASSTRRAGADSPLDRSPGSTPWSGHFADSGEFRPRPARFAGDGRDAPDALHQLFGDVWEWTRSPFSPYPRFHPALGAAGEYNGKFMCGQFVLRGGSCVTPAGHLRSTYRNFFPPHARWQFSGLRLARDA